MIGRLAAGSEQHPFIGVYPGIASGSEGILKDESEDSDDDEKTDQENDADRASDEFEHVEPSLE